jgi:transmembrane sensor
MRYRCGYNAAAMKNRFYELFQRFKNDTATQREIEELGRMFLSGEYDELVREEIGHAIREVIRQGKPEQRSDVQPVEEILKVVPGNRSKQRKVIPLYRRTGFQVAASLAMLLVLALWFTVDKHPPEEVSQETATADLTTKRERVLLPDGSLVYLNNGSTISYSDDFGTDDREVVLKGEGFFDVKHNTAKPFKVHSLGVEVTVLGTAFNVNAYPGKKDVTVTVARGLVAVGHGNEVFGKIRPDQEIVVDTSTFRYEIKEVNAKKAIQWTENFLLFDNVTLSQAVGILEDRYGVKFVFSNPALADCKIHGTFLNDEALPDVLTKICTITHWDYAINGSTVTINGQGCY